MCRCVSVFSALLFLVVCCHHIPRSCASRFAVSQVNCAQRNTHKTQNTQHAGRKTQHRTASREMFTQDEDSVPVTNRVQRGETSCALTSSNHLASLSEYLQRSLSGCRFVPCENKCATSLLRWSPSQDTKPHCRTPLNRSSAYTCDQHYGT